MHHVLRRSCCTLIALASAGCGSLGTSADAPPPAAQPVAQQAPAPGSEAWLEAYRRRLAQIRAGETVAPPMQAAPGVTAESAAGQPAVAPAPEPAAAEPEAPAAVEPAAEPAASEPPAVTGPEPEPPSAEPEPVVAPAAVAPPAVEPQEAPPAPVRPAPPPAAELKHILQQSREHAALVDQKIAVLVGAFVQKGLEAWDGGDLKAAHEAFASAYELDPTDPAARDLYERSGALLGTPGTSLAAIASTARDKAGARAEQNRLLVMHHVQQGDAAMAGDDAPAAVGHFEDALTLLRADPNAAQGGLGEAEVAAKVAMARHAAADSADRRNATLQGRAAALQEDFDQAEAAREQLRIDHLMQNANAAFLQDEYADAESALDEVLRLQPGNAEAENLRRIASKARHDQAGRVTRVEYRTQWQDTFDELRHDSVPQNDLMVFPEADQWAVVSGHGSKSFGSGATASTELDDAVRESLQKAIPVSFQDEPLSQVIAHLQAVTGVNMILSPGVKNLGTEPTITLEDRHSQPVARILKIVLEDLSEPKLSSTIRDGVLHVITTDEARADYVLQMYDIRDLTFTPKDYQADDFNLLPSGTDAESFQKGVEDEAPAPFIGADALVTLIQNNIEPDSWTADPNRTIQLMPGTLIVRQVPEVHQQIDELLANLRINTNTLVHIETRFIEVEDSFLEDIGVDLRGLEGNLTGGFPLEDFGQSGRGGFGTPNSPAGIGTGNDPGFFYAGNDGDIKGRIENLFDFTLGEKGTLNNAGGLSVQAMFLNDDNVEAVIHAVSKYQTSNVVNAPSLTLRSGQRGNVKALTTRTYVRDFEPEIAQAAVIAQPELDNVKEGVMLDVRAVASADKRFVTLELRPTVIDLVPDENGAVLPTKTVSLGTQNSGNVTIELPELRIQRLRTTATLPDGASLMLGGLKTSVDQDMNSGVPFLSDIPIIGSLFSREGEYTSKRKLIILLKATIVSPEEHEPALRGASR